MFIWTFFDHKNLGNHLLQLCSKVVKHPVYHSQHFPFGPAFACQAGNFWTLLRTQLARTALKHQRKCWQFTSLAAVPVDKPIIKSTIRTICILRPKFSRPRKGTWCLDIIILYILFTDLLASRSRVLLEKLIDSQVVKKFPAFYGNLRFITAFTSARHLSLSWARLIQSMPLWIVRNMIRFYCEELLALRPTPNLEDHPLSAVRDCLSNIFAATLRIGGRSSLRILRTRHAVVTGTHWSWMNVL